MKNKLIKQLQGFLSGLKEYWAIIVAVGGAFAAIIILPYRVDAMDKRQDKLEAVQDKIVEQTTALYKWVDQEQKEKEYEKERLTSAPPGYKWDSVSRKYDKQ